MQRKAMTRMMGLQFKVVYRQGKENAVADIVQGVSLDGPAVCLYFSTYLVAGGV